MSWGFVVGVLLVFAIMGIVMFWPNLLDAWEFAVALASGL